VSWLHTRTLRRIAPLVGVILVVSSLEPLLSALKVPGYLLPRPTQILAALVDQRALLWMHLQVTAIEAFGGFVVGSLFSIGFGFLVVYSPVVKAAVMPYMVLIQTMPKIALAPLFVIWLGIGLRTNVVYTALIAFFPVLVNFVQGLEDVNQNELRLMESYNASKWQLFRHVHLYRALPYLFAGLKMAGVLSIIGAVVSEFVASDGGLGYYMVQSQNLLRTSDAFAAFTVLTVMGWAFYILIDLVHRRVTPWRVGGDVGAQQDIV
jgi:NitT/TauT family transport system permease protein